jgi:perosamine synthetase
MSRQSRIPYGRQSINQSDIQAVVRALKSPLLTCGPLVEQFEEAFAKYCGSRYAIAVSSGTAGLHLAAMAADFKPKDEVITAPMSFVATANAILYVGAQPIFADINHQSLSLDSMALDKSMHAKTRGIIPVHFAGQPCNVLVNKTNIIKDKRITIIEDACHALGAEQKINGRYRRIGNNLRNDMVVFSFHPVKHIATGEGGMITTSRKDLYELLKDLRSHGITRDPKKFTYTANKKLPWYYEMQRLSFNYRITDIQCALGLSQLKRIHLFVSQRRSIAQIYDAEFEDLEFVQTPAHIEGSKSSYHLYPLRIDFERLKKSRQVVMQALGRLGIGTQVHYIPITKQPYYRKNVKQANMNYPESDHYYRQALSIPIFPAMKDSEVQRVVRGIKKVCSKGHVI